MVGGTAAFVRDKSKVTILPKKIQIPMVRIPPGSFLMGSPADEPGRSSINETEHPVNITIPFEIAETEVTQEQFESVMAMNPSLRKNPSYPVSDVTWYTAVRFCNELSVLMKLEPCYRINESGPSIIVEWPNRYCNGYRLPTEAEWEYAARGGETYPFAGSDNADAVAWHISNSGGQSHAVSEKAANKRGLRDMSGNVWEWVWDRYSREYSSGKDIDPIGSETEARRTLKGGSFSEEVSECRIASRRGSPPTKFYSGLGFRLARTVN